VNLVIRPTVIACIAFTLASTTTACAAGSGDNPGKQATSAPSLVVGKSGDYRPDAAIGGRLWVNDSDCFTLGDAILVADPGSTVLEDGSGVDLPGFGVVKIGTRINGGGGYYDYESVADVPDFARDCVDDARPIQLVTIWYDGS